MKDDELINLLTKCKEKLELYRNKLGGSHEYIGGMPIHWLIPKIDCYLKKITPVQCACGNPPMHKCSKDGNMCCYCYVAKGNPPTDWHASCMNAHHLLSKLPELKS